MHKDLTVYRARSIGMSKDTATINISKQLSHDLFSATQDYDLAKDAEDIAQALYDTLPYATFEKLIAKLIELKDKSET